MTEFQKNTNSLGEKAKRIVGRQGLKIVMCVFYSDFLVKKSIFIELNEIYEKFFQRNPFLKRLELQFKKN